MRPMILCAPALISLCVACTGEGPPPVEPTKHSAAIYVMNAGVDAPALDILVDGKLGIPLGVGYREGGRIVDLSAGEHQVEVRAAGTQDAPLSAATVKLGEGDAVFLLAMGRVADGAPAAEKFGLHSYSFFRTLGEREVRLIHAAPGLGAASAVYGVQTVAENVLYGQESAFSTLPDPLPSKDKLSIRSAEGEVVQGADLLKAGTEYESVTAVLVGDPAAPARSSKALAVSVLNDSTGAVTPLPKPATL